MGMSLGRGQTGGGVAAPLWGAYMRQALSNLPVRDFPRYAELEHALIATESGLLPGSGCADVMDEIFIPGTVPTEIDTMCGEYSRGRELKLREPDEDIAAAHKRTIDREIGSTAPDEGSIADIGLDLLD
jgi:membrane carboxypeptidase/penicillin-binding protein